MGPLGDDLRFGFRLLWRHPTFSVLALLTLALGIGTNTAVFSIVRGVLLKPLPFREPENLLWFGGKDARFSTEREGVSIPDLLDVRNQTRTLATVGAYSFFTDKLIVTGLGEPEQVDGMRVTANFFDILGIPPTLGRTFKDGEDLAGGPRVAVLSQDYWTRNYAADPTIVGRTITINSVSYEIVGVMPTGFEFPSRIQIWIPAAVGRLAGQGREYRSFLCLARPRPGISIPVAAQELQAIAVELERTLPASNTGYRFDAKLLAEHVSGSVRDSLYLLSGITFFLLLIGAANVANLLLARATGRRREVAIRHALGAPRLAIARQMLAESVVLAVLGGAVGSVLAWWGIRALRAWNPPELPRASELSVDPVSLLFALAVSVFTAILFGLAPAMQAVKADQHDALRDSGSRGGGEGAGRNRLRGFLVVAEIGLAVVLLAGAGLLLESLRRLLSVDPGFRTADLVTTEMTLPMRKFHTLDATSTFVENYCSRLRTLPGVQSAGATIALPMGSMYTFYEFRIAGDPPLPIPSFAGYTAVTPGYLETMGIPLRQGRLFDARDGRDAPKTVIISEPLARQYFAGRNPIGRRLQIFTGAPEPFEGEVIGVLGGIRHEDLAHEPRVELYVPLLQSPYPVANIVVRSELPRDSVAAAMKRSLRDLDPNLPLYRIRMMEEVVLETAAAPRARGYLTAIFAAAALLLASIGIYGVMSYAVARRSQEIGIRMALGATPMDVMAMVLGQSAKLVIAGLGGGLLLTMVLGRLLGNLLFGISAFDPVVIAVVSVLLVIVAGLATGLPAFRAARIAPLNALRQE